MGNAVNTYNASRLAPQYPQPDYARQAVQLGVSLVLPAGQVIAEKVGNNEVQHIAVDATGGTFTLAYNSSAPSTAIPFGATVGQVLAALEALPTVGEDNVKVAGSAGAYDVTFQNQLGDQNVPALVADSTSLTGNTHTATVTTTTAGSAGAPGVFYAYDDEQTDGRQVPKGFLEYPCATDSSGNISIGGAAGVGSFGITELTAPAYFTGSFKTKELVGFNTNAATLLGGHLISGDIDDGIYTF